MIFRQKFKAGRAGAPALQPIAEAPPAVSVLAVPSPPEHQLHRLTTEEIAERLPSRGSGSGRKNVQPGYVIVVYALFYIFGSIKAKTHYCDPTRLSPAGSPTKSGRVADLSGLVANFSGFFWVADLVGSISTCTDFFVGSQTSLVGSGRVAVVEFRNDPTKHE